MWMWCVVGATGSGVQRVAPSAILRRRVVLLELATGWEILGPLVAAWPLGEGPSQVMGTTPPFAQLFTRINGWAMMMGDNQ